VYACRGEDRWCAIAVFTEEEWKSFILAIGEPEWTEDPKLASFSGRKENEDELDRLVGDWTCNFTAEEVMIRLQSFGVPAGVVETCEDVHHDPQLKHRHHFRRLEHPEIGKHTYDCSPFRLSRNPTDLQMPGPCLGEHNEHVFTKILGMSDEEFVQLLGEGVFD
jgi:benzylsuccinate CoA-transferase BbsF subunit